MSLKRRPPEGNVRRVVSTGLNIRGVITNKAGRIVQFESSAERVLLLLLERDPDVRDFGSQPETFEYVDGYGKSHTYTPDFIVWRYSGGIEIHQVIRSERHSRRSICQREEVAEEICQKRGWHYIVHSEKTLPQQTEVANLLALFRYRLEVYASEAVIRAVHERLGHMMPTPLRELMAHIASALGLQERIVYSALCHLLWHGEISTDFQTLFIVDGTFTPKAPVWSSLKKEG